MNCMTDHSSPEAPSLFSSPPILPWFIVVRNQLITRIPEPVIKVNI